MENAFSARVVPLRPTTAPTIAPGVAPFTPVRFARGGVGLPRRSWLYGRHYIRGYVGATVSPGGVGKSALTIAEALAMATGRNLLGENVAKPLRVWLWNGEDPVDEIMRRIAGACLHYGIQPEELEGRLFADSGRDVPISLAAQSREGVIVHEHVRDSILEHVRANRIDVVIFDPFVSLHAVGENDNGAIDMVMILAHFDAEIGGLTAFGFALVQSARSGLAIWPPRVGGPDSNRRMVIVQDSNLRADLLRAALLAFEALGGRYPEPVAEDRRHRTAQRRTLRAGGQDQ